MGTLIDRSPSVRCGNLPDRIRTYAWLVEIFRSFAARGTLTAQGSSPTTKRLTSSTSTSCALLKLNCPGLPIEIECFLTLVKGYKITNH